MSKYWIGTTLGNMVDVSSLLASGDDLPLGDFQRWAVTLDLGDATVRALGRPIASWYWCYMSESTRVALQAYCPSKSARVYIRTVDNPASGATTTYSGVMIWPDTDYLYNQDEFRLVFRDLVQEIVT